MKRESGDGSVVRAVVLVNGRVQGVGYRAAARDRAASLCLHGWVRNLPDGSVELSAEGPQPKVTVLIDWCWRGPVFARVTDVVVTWEAPVGDASGFDIRH